MTGRRQQKCRCQTVDAPVGARLVRKPCRRTRGSTGYAGGAPFGSALFLLKGSNVLPPFTMRPCGGCAFSACPGRCRMPLFRAALVQSLCSGPGLRAPAGVLPARAVCRERRPPVFRPAVLPQKRRLFLFWGQKKARFSAGGVEKRAAARTGEAQMRLAGGKRAGITVLYAGGDGR